MSTPSKVRHCTHALFGALIALSAATAQATIYKCRGGGGAPIYQDEPCLTGKELRDFDKDPPTVSVMSLAPPNGTTTRQTLPPPPKARIVTRAKTPAVPTGNPSERKFLAPGINEGEVLTRVGPPNLKSGGNGRKIARWTYLPVPEDASTITTLTFEHGRLVEVERKVVR